MSVKKPLIRLSFNRFMDVVVKQLSRSKPGKKGTLYLILAVNHAKRAH